jgi:transcriptional regulator with XRE-family HTH domain
MNTKILQRFGQTLKNKRKEIGISQEQLAEKLNIHRTYMSFLERGLRNPSLLMLFKISRALRVNLSELFEFDKIN